MRAIGFCVAPREVSYVVIDGDPGDGQFVLVTKGKFAAPRTLAGSEAAQLAWYRERVIAVVRDHKADVAGLRFADGGGKRSPSATRLRMEGVLLESLYSAHIPLGAVGAASHIKSRLGASRKLSEYVKEDKELRGISLEKRSRPIIHAIEIACASIGKSNAKSRNN